MSYRGVTRVLASLLLGGCSGGGDSGSGGGTDSATESTGTTSSTGSATDTATAGTSTTATTSPTSTTSASTTGTGTTGGGPPPSGLPTGIPEPEFGWGFETDADPTIYVDNTNGNCSNAGAGTAAEPLCDLYRGQSSATYSAGDVVSILGGPYVIDSDKALTLDGTQADPVIIKGSGLIRFDAEGNRADFTFDGSYGILENIEFFHNTKHAVAATADHLVFRGIEIHNPAGAFIDFNPVLNIAGTQILVHDSKIYDNRRMTDADTHGIQAWQGSSWIFLIDNELYNNNGDSFQSCHQCYTDTPHHIFIGRNVMHEDRENAVDLKTVHDVVVSENIMWGYAASMTSNGDAMVIGSNGFDENVGQGPRRVWVINNEIRDSATGLRIEGVEDATIVGNVFTGLTRGLQIDNKEYRDIVIAANTLSDMDDGIVNWNDGCTADSVTIANNIVTATLGRHLDLPDCANLTLSNNLLYNDGGGFDARIAGQNYADAATLNGQAYASMNLDADPQFEAGTLLPAVGAPPVDAGGSLDSHYVTFEAQIDEDIREDRDHVPRPSGSAQDIGAYERP